MEICSAVGSGLYFKLLVAKINTLVLLSFKGAKGWTGFTSNK